MADLLIENGTCVSADGTFEADVAVRDGKIEAVGDLSVDADERVDAAGLLVMPGFVDPHVHIHDSASVDTYRTASAAAAVGGITTVIDFAWQSETNVADAEPRSLVEGIERKRAKAEETGSYIDYGLHAGITVETPDVLDDLADAVAAGVTSFKMFTAYDMALSNGFIQRVVERIADLDAVGIFHTEDNAIIETLVAEFEAAGRSDPTWFPRSRPDYAEAMAADDVLRIAEAFDAKYFGLHTTCRKSADVIDDFQTDGSRVRGETCTHYTVLDDSVYEEQGNLPLIGPPIRKPDDIEAMFEYLRSGTLSVVSTDHAPHYREEKAVDWWDSPFGAGSLQTSVPVFHDAAVNDRDFSYPFLVATMSTNPAQTFGLEEKGSLDPGTDADIVLFDPERELTITADDNHSNGDFTIYEGRTVQGAVERTYVRGELVAEDGDIVGPANGEFVERPCPDWSV